MDRDFPMRKHIRMKTYDYSTSGSYFVTICTQRRKRVLSDVVWNLNHTEIRLKPFGLIAQKELLSLSERYSFLTVDLYVIMPNHIHVILVFEDQEKNETAKTLSDVVCAFKSTVSRKCFQNGAKEKIFQTSFYEHVIRNSNDYDAVAEYIAENPNKWPHDVLYTD